MSGLRAALDEMLAEHALPALTDEQWAKHRSITHLRIAENTPLCSRDPNPPNALGHWLRDDPADVGCPKCLEWMHA